MNETYTNLNQHLDVAPEVAQALKEGRPVVALESTIISHGMPYPKNVETALRVEQTLRDNGAVPATIAVIGGRLKAGLSREEIEYLGKTGRGVAKASRRDLPVLVARKADGATTVATTMIIASMAGIRIFATGGIGGVHRGAEVTMDISADLEELAQTPVMVVCAGAKSILDLGLTLEYLETKGVPVIGFGTEELPAFYTRRSGFGVDYRVDSPEELAAVFRAQPSMPPSGIWTTRAACWSPTPSPRSTPWTRPSLTPPSKKPSARPKSRESTERRPRPSCWRRWWSSPAVTAWRATSSWCSTTPGWRPGPPGALRRRTEAYNLHPHKNWNRGGPLTGACRGSGFLFQLIWVRRPFPARPEGLFVRSPAAFSPGRRPCRSSAQSTPQPRRCRTATVQRRGPTGRPAPCGWRPPPPHRACTAG